ncbi:MAG: hypothetical protein M3014_00225, partial [Chloroflexota bacterium]|nr:hypothetical protein [Chloroflexota bacterium]
MIKLLSRIFDTTDKEVGRLRRIASQANEEIERLLENQREHISTLRSQAFATVQTGGGALSFSEIQASEMRFVAENARRLSGEVDSLRATMERGEQTSRDLSVLLADSRQLSQMNTEKSQRAPAERRELEEEIELLIIELGVQLNALLETKPGLREAILQAVPKAKLHPQKPAAEEMVKQVETTAAFLGREVADYFSRTNETLLALRRGIGLTTLVALTPTDAGVRP